MPASSQGWEVKGQSKGNKRDPCSNETVLYLDCLDASILVLRAYYSLARCYRWGKLVKSYTQSLKDFLYMIKESSRLWVAWKLYHGEMTERCGRGEKTQEQYLAAMWKKD